MPAKTTDTSIREVFEQADAALKQVAAEADSLASRLSELMDKTLEVFDAAESAGSKIDWEGQLETFARQLSVLSTTGRKLEEDDLRLQRSLRNEFGALEVLVNPDLFEPFSDPELETLERLSERFQARRAHYLRIADTLVEFLAEIDSELAATVAELRQIQEAS